MIGKSIIIGVAVFAPFLDPFGSCVASRLNSTSLPANVPSLTSHNRLRPRNERNFTNRGRSRKLEKGSLLSTIVRYSEHKNPRDSDKRLIVSSEIVRFGTRVRMESIRPNDFHRLERILRYSPLKSWTLILSGETIPWNVLSDGNVKLTKLLQRVPRDYHVIVSETIFGMPLHHLSKTQTFTIASQSTNIFA